MIMITMHLWAGLPKSFQLDYGAIGLLYVEDMCDTFMVNAI